MDIEVEMDGNEGIINLYVEPGNDVVNLLKSDFPIPHFYRQNDPDYYHYMDSKRIPIDILRPL